jgi:hypothetical protein
MVIVIMAAYDMAVDAEARSGRSECVVGSDSGAMASESACLHGEPILRTR